MQAFNSQFLITFTHLTLNISSFSSKQIAKLLENTSNDKMAVQALVANDIVSPLLKTITDEYVVLF